MTKRSVCLKAVVVCMGILCLTLLGACGFAGVSDSQLSKDLEASPYFQNSGMSPLQIDTVKVSKRMTDPDTKTDEIWCTVSLSSSVFDQEDSLLVKYTKYTKGGWIMDDYEVLSSVKTLKEGPGEDDLAMAEAAVLERYYYWPNCTVTTELGEVDLDAFTATIRCTAVYEGTLLRYTQPCEVTMKWDVEGRWQVYRYPKEGTDKIELLRDISGHYYAGTSSNNCEFDVAFDGDYFVATNIMRENHFYVTMSSPIALKDARGLMDVSFTKGKAYLCLDGNREDRGMYTFLSYFDEDGKALLYTP